MSRIAAAINGLEDDSRLEACGDSAKLVLIRRRERLDAAIVILMVMIVVVLSLPVCAAFLERAAVREAPQQIERVAPHLTGAGSAPMLA